eukprot:766818-Hanusia_phi.AAC.6
MLLDAVTTIASGLDSRSQITRQLISSKVRPGIQTQRDELCVGVCTQGYHEEEEIVGGLQEQEK